MKQFLFLFLLFTQLIWSNTDSDLFFKNFKNKVYHLNSVLVPEMETSLKSKFQVLSEILEFHRPQLTRTTLGERPDEKLVDYLILGYNELYKKEYSSLKTYEYFSQALNLAAELQSSEGIKFCLVSIFELLRNEIFIGSEQFKPYLQRYQELINSPDDELIFAFYTLIFSAKEDEDMNTSINYKRNMKVLDSIFKGVQVNHPYYPYYLYNKGVFQKLQADYNSALASYEQAITLCDVPHREELKKTLLWQIAHCYYLNKNLPKANEFLKESEKRSATGRDQFYDSRLKAWILSSQGVYDSAYHYMKLSVDLEYKLGYKNNTLETALLAVENQTEKLKLDNYISEQSRKRNRNWLVVAGIALLFGSSFAVLLQQNTFKKKKLAEQEVILKQQKVENLLKEQELVSIDAMIAGQEKERQKVAGELHDDLGSLMATIKLHFDNVQTNEEDPALKNAQQLLEEAYQKIRGIAHGKNSGVMSDQGLLYAVQNMANSISESKVLEVLVEDFGMGERLENSLELSIFRMIQELVANVIKHAEATKVTIQLTQHQDNLNIIIEDNGKGFDWSKINRNSSGMGLVTIEKRVEYLEGSFTVDSIIGKGTTILIDIPV